MAVYRYVDVSDFDASQSQFAFVESDGDVFFRFSALGSDDQVLAEALQATSLIGFLRGGREIDYVEVLAGVAPDGIRVSRIPSRLEIGEVYEVWTSEPEPHRSGARLYQLVRPYLDFNDLQNKPHIAWQDAWQTETAYAAGHIVVFEGELYIYMKPVDATNTTNPHDDVGQHTAHLPVGDPEDVEDVTESGGVLTIHRRDGTTSKLSPVTASTVVAAIKKMTNAQDDEVRKALKVSKSDHAHDGRYAWATHNHNTLYPRKDHQHDGRYAWATHNHNDLYFREFESDARYARTAHTHAYSASNHEHDGRYAWATHNHNTLYPRKDHVHDGRYAWTAHNHNTLYPRKDHQHDGRYAWAVHTHSGYAKSDHTHSGYATTGHTHTGYVTFSFLSATVSGYSRTSHTHTGYASSGHTHSGYATTSGVNLALQQQTAWTQRGFASISHTHTGYALSSHTHSYVTYAFLSATVSGYSRTSHTHTGYASTGHYHTSGVGPGAVLGAFLSMGASGLRQIGSLLSSYV